MLDPHLIVKIIDFGESYCKKIQKLDTFTCGYTVPYCP